MTNDLWIIGHQSKLHLLPRGLPLYEGKVQAASENPTPPRPYKQRARRLRPGQLVAG